MDEEQIIFKFSFSPLVLLISGALKSSGGSAFQHIQPPPISAVAHYGQRKVENAQSAVGEAGDGRDSVLLVSSDERDETVTNGTEKSETFCTFRRIVTTLLFVLCIFYCSR